VGEKQGLLAGFTLGATHLVFFGAYALALWYGSRRVADGEMDGGKVGPSVPLFGLISAGCAMLGWAMLCCAVLCWAVLGCAGLG
jgi:hypothetical protein